MRDVVHLPDMNISVLVVDDQPDLRLLVRTLIDAENHGLTCGAEAASGEEAVAYFDGGSATVVVLDQMMPGMTGTEAARQILARYPAQKIILFSAYVDDQLIAEAKEIGISACLDKREFAKVAATVRVVAAA